MLVPEITGNVVTTVQGPMVIQVRWTKQTIKPGNTTYIVKAYEVLEGTNTYVKYITVNGKSIIYIYCSIKSLKKYNQEAIQHNIVSGNFTIIFKR